MNITSIIFGLIFLMFGLLLAIGKIHSHLKAWKSTPQEVKDNIKIKPLLVNVGIVIMISGIIFIVNGFSKYFKDHLFVIFMAIWLFLAGIDLILISKTKFYLKTKKNKD